MLRVRVPACEHDCVWDYLPLAWRAYKSQIQTDITQTGTVQFRSLYLGPEQMATDPLSQTLNRATAAGRQSESPSICISLENAALLHLY